MKNLSTVVIKSANNVTPVLKTSSLKIKKEKHAITLDYLTYKQLRTLKQVLKKDLC